MTTERIIEIKLLISDELPATVHGAAVKTRDGKYLMIINGNDTRGQQEKTAAHEWGHIYRGDHDRTDASADQIEAEAHRQSL